MSTKRTPEGIGKAGATVWKSITSTYELRADELVTLEDACAITDMIASLSDSWAELGKPLMTKGSMGQEIIHPLIGEIRTQRMARNALWRQLKLPEDGATEAPANQQRDAANSRWATGKGRGA